MFFNSTRLTLIPHGSVATSSVALIFVLIVSRDVRVSSSSRSPMMLRSVVAVRFSIAMIGFSTPYAYSFGSVIWKYTTVSICMVTLSFVITGCGGKSTTCSFSSTFLATLSINGTLKCRPTCHVAMYPPSLSTITACACGTIFTQLARIASTMIKIMIPAIMPPISYSSLFFFTINFTPAIRTIFASSPGSITSLSSSARTVHSCPWTTAVPV